MRSWPRRDFSLLGRRGMEVAHLGRAWNVVEVAILAKKKGRRERRGRAPKKKKKL